MEDLSEQSIRQNCPHCNTHSQAFLYPLKETNNFHIICDGHPLVEGHILIIPKQHLSCVGEYPDYLFKEFIKLNKKVSQFLKKEYGSVSSFEHGIFGQTVFHSHIHYLPFKGKSVDIVPENKLSQISDLSELKILFKKDKGYLFFSLENKLMSVDTNLTAPRFFRDRFAIALGREERADWKSMHNNQKLMQEAQKESESIQRKWKLFFR